MEMLRSPEQRYLLLKYLVGRCSELLGMIESEKSKLVGSPDEVSSAIEETRSNLSRLKAEYDRTSMELEMVRGDRELL